MPTWLLLVLALKLLSITNHVDFRTHYSFDFAQQFTPLQPSKWSLAYVVFLVGDIRLYHNIKSLLDYEMYTRKWPKAVTSYLHNFFGTWGLASNDFRTHYSFDFAQQFTPLQPSKWSLAYVVFLVGDIRLYHNIKSLLDYEMYTRKWSKAVTSYLHNFLELGV